MSIFTDLDTTTGKELFKNVIYEIWDSTDVSPNIYWKEIFNVKTTNDEFEKALDMAGFDTMSELDEGEPIPTSDPLFGAVKEYTQVAYGHGFRISHRMKKFNKHGLMEHFTRNLKRQMAEGKCIEVAKLYNDPTGATYGEVGFQGTDNLAEAAGTLLDGNTYDNIGSTAFSAAAFESAHYYFRTLKDDRNIHVGAKPSHLIIEPTLEVQAKEMLQSTLKAHEMSNTKNVYGDWGIKLYVYPRYSSTTAWAMIAKNHEGFDLNVWTSQEPELRIEDTGDLTRDTVATSMQYFDYGFGNPRLYYSGNT